MNIFNHLYIKKALSLSLKKGYTKWIPYFYKYLPLNWKDDKGNNLFHFSAIHQNKYLFDLALHNGANINDSDHKGNAPIHRFIEACFIINEDKDIEEKVIFDFNENLLKLFISEGADVNKWLQDGRKNEEEVDKLPPLTKDNIMGSPIELLIQVFWNNIIDKIRVNAIPNKTQLLSIKKYHEMYAILSHAGTNINLLKEQGEFYNLKDERTIDVMQLTPSVVASHFFMKFLYVDKDLRAVMPIISDPNLDFYLQDDSKNTVLHHLFGRLSTRYSFFNRETVHDTLLLLLNNPSIKEEHFYIENTFRLNPISCLKKDAREYRVFIEKFFLNKKLEKEMLSKENTQPIRRHKI